MEILNFSSKNKELLFFLSKYENAKIEDKKIKSVYIDSLNSIDYSKYYNFAIVMVESKSGVIDSEYLEFLKESLIKKVLLIVVETEINDHFKASSISAKEIANIKDVKSIGHMVLLKTDLNSDDCIDYYCDKIREILTIELRYLEIGE